MIAALVDDKSGALKKSSVDNRGEDTIRSNPRGALIDDTALLQLVRNAIEDVVADIFFVCQNLMDRCASPGTTEIAHDAPLIQRECNFALRLTFLDKHRIDAVNVFDFFRRTRSKDDAVGLETLSITTPEFTLGVSTLIDQEPSQAKPSRTTLAKAVFDETAL